MQVSIVSVRQNPKTRLVEAEIMYPGALSTTKLIFTSLPSELGTEFYSKASKETLDSMRGLKKSASRNRDNS